MASPWQGGENFVKIPRGSKVGRKGGSNSGPSGKRWSRFRPDTQQPKEQSAKQKELNKKLTKVIRWRNKMTINMPLEEFLNSPYAK